MIKPPRLNRGDRVRIVAPASPVRQEMFEAGIHAMNAAGLVPVYEDPFSRWRYLAGSDAHRRAEFEEAMSDETSRAIFFARGGYGCSRLLQNGFAKQFNPKILLGCSDVTTLHLYFQEVCGWTVFHGPMAAGDFSRGQVHFESLFKAISQSEPYELNPEVEELHGGSAEGVLKGGCLTLLDAAIGTAWEAHWNGCILFLEDVSVKPYQIDRMLTHLKVAGKFEGVRAFIFGEMKDCIQIENQGYTLQEVIMDCLSDFNVPVYFGFPSGHVNDLNWTIPFGVRAKVTGSPFCLQIMEGAVE